MFQPCSFFFHILALCVKKGPQIRLYCFSDGFFFSAGKMALKTSFHLLLFFMFVDATPYNITDEPQLNLIQCYDNEWQCEDRCIHKRRVCNQNGTNFCHQDFPISCGDRQRCHKKVSFRQNLMSFYTKATFLLIVFEQQTWLRNLLARKTSIECYFLLCNKKKPV